MKFTSSENVVFLLIPHAWFFPPNTYAHAVWKYSMEYFHTAYLFIIDDHSKLLLSKSKTSRYEANEDFKREPKSGKTLSNWGASTAEMISKIIFTWKVTFKGSRPDFEFH